MSLPKPDTCKDCIGWGWGCEGYVPADGTGDNGVLVILEAAGEVEAHEGKPVMGPAGQFLWNQLRRVGIEREGFRVHNVLSCRPPKNWLAGAPWEAKVIASCSPNLDRTIEAHVAHCEAIGKTPVIVSLGKISFKRLTGAKEGDTILKEDYIAYPFWLQRYGCILLAAPHPSYIMQGKQIFVPILQYVFQRALEIASEGMVFDNHDDTYLIDPPAAIFDRWIDDYETALASEPDETFLSYDIETAYKQKADESELKLAEDPDQILRCSFCYKPNHSVSVPWRTEYKPGLIRLFGSLGPKVGWNSEQFDSPKIKAEMPIRGDEIDAMNAWHVLNTSMRKGLGFVTPYYAQTTQMWKHLASEPSLAAFYNAKDADMALRCWLGIREDLHRNNLWEVFSRHVVEVHRVFKFMGERGVRLDLAGRQAAEEKLTGLLNDIETRMEQAVPQEARKLKVIKKTPKDTTGLVQVPGEAKTKCCLNCGAVGVVASHFKSIGKKRLTSCATCGKPRKQHCDLDTPGLDHEASCKKLHHEFKAEAENPCHGQKPVVKLLPVQFWAKPLEFKISKLGLLNYQKALKHHAIINRRENKVTFDESAIKKLQTKYPKDPLYPLILEHRSKQKLLSTYIGITDPLGRIQGGMPFDKDGLVHTTFTSNPSTLRSASQNPNLQNLPRPTDELAALVRNLIIASEGHTLYARDFSGIEAVLVGYEAAAPGYMRLARRDVHTFYTVYALYELGDPRVKANDLPLLSWDDDKLFTHLEHLKKEFKKDRNSLYKHLVHAANFMQSAKGAKDKIYAETGHEYEQRTVQKVMDIYFALFPEIRRWHGTALLQAEKDGYLRNAFGYVHRFAHVFLYEKEDGRWHKRPNPDVANKVVAFPAQSNAAGIIKEAMLRLYHDHYLAAGQWLRLLIHDELFFDVPTPQLEALDKVVQSVMEYPIPQMPLPESYGLGSHLSILTEAKQGPRWGQMK